MYCFYYFKHYLIYFTKYDIIVLCKAQTAIGKRYAKMKFIKEKEFQIGENFAYAKFLPVRTWLHAEWSEAKWSVQSSVKFGIQI